MLITNLKKVNILLYQQLVPLKMEFLIQNRNENGLSSDGKFITPYYKVTNNGSHKLKVHFESFEYANSKLLKLVI